jgi:glycosidase
MKLSQLASPLLALSLLGACAQAPELQGNPITPPGSGGGYNPSGGSGPSGSYGSGASGAGGPTTGAGGEGGVMDPGPPMCDDTLKRCAHLFTFPAGNESKVEIHGDFAPDGWAVGVPMAKNGAQWEASIEIAWNVDVQYKLVVDGTWIADPGQPATIDDGFGGKNSLLAGATCDVWTCVPETLGTFDWRDAVLYFVFVDRFLDGDPSNNGAPPAGVEQPAAYRGGDWAGVTKKINENYFNDLGVNTLWLSVPVDNTENAGLGSDGHKYSAYHGYWPTNLDKPEGHFGTMAELKALVDAAHAKKLKVILDYAMNHVHIDSPVYAQHKDWFWPLNDGQVNNCTCGGGCSWDGDQGKRCWFTDYLPDFNFKTADARNFSVGNAVGWIKDTGIDGFRLDAVKHIEDAWLTDLRAKVKAEIEPVTGEHFYMVGETFTGDQGLIKYYVNPAMLDGQFDFPLRSKLLRSILLRAGDQNSTMSALDGFLAQNENVYGSGVMSTFIGNHDVPRPIHFAEDSPLWGTGDGVEWTNGKDRAWSNQPGLPGGTSAFERVANAYTVLYTQKGIPLVYYGDEVAMPGAGDPDNRRMMQWSGYSAGQSLVKDHLTKLAKIRADHVALRRGARSSLSSSNDTMAYKMTSGGDTVYVAINRSDASQMVGGLPGGMLKDLLTGNTVSGGNIAVPARKSMILVVP